MQSMHCIWYLFIVIALTSQANAIKVNMHGAVSLGSAVLESLSRYIKKNSINGRRSMAGSKEADSITAIVKSAYLCRDLDFCDKPLAKFINEYVTVLAENVERIFFGIVAESYKIEDQILMSKAIIFEDGLRDCVRRVKKVLKSANDKITENNEVYVWLDIIKSISAIFQEAAIVFVTESLEGKSQELKEVKKILIQKLVISTITVEGKYETKLCRDFKICSKSIECTKSLNDFLVHIKTANEEKVKLFVKSFYEVLPETKFYSKLSEETANEFQIILNEMSYSGKVPAKDVLLSIHKAVKDRIENKETNARGQDIELVNVILSDLDHFYSKSRIDPFFKFLRSFYEWLKSGGRFNASLRQVMKDISKQLQSVPTEKNAKLINEIKVFLEITVDPQ